LVRTTRGVDEGGLGPLPPPVELGQRIAIGLAHLDTGRAARELLTLFQHQWKSGKVPHIVFNPEAPPDSYFPGAEHRACAAASPEAPPALY
jgi:glucosylglycerate hydrolase